MAGNVAEWCDDDFEKGYYQRLKAAQGKWTTIPAPTSGVAEYGMKAIRGGLFLDELRRCSAAWRSGSMKAGGNIGFRLAYDPPE